MPWELLEESRPGQLAQIEGAGGVTVLRPDCGIGQPRQAIVAFVGMELEGQQLRNKDAVIGRRVVNPVVDDREEILRRADRRRRRHRDADALELVQKDHRGPTALRPAGHKERPPGNSELGTSGLPRPKHVETGLLCGGLGQIAVGLPRGTFPEVIRCDDDVSLAGKLGQHQPSFHRLIRTGGDSTFGKNRSVLVGDHGECLPSGLGNGQQSGGHGRPVVQLGNHRAVGDPVERHRMAGRRIGHRIIRELPGHLLGQHLVQQIDAVGADRLPSDA